MKEAEEEQKIEEKEYQRSKEVIKDSAVPSLKGSRWKKQKH